MQCLNLCCPRCSYFNSLLFVDELLEVFSDCKKLRFIAILCPAGRLRKRELNYKNDHPSLFYYEFLRAITPVTKYINKGVLCVETKWDLEKKRWIIHLHFLCSVTEVKPVKNRLKKFYNKGYFKDKRAIRFDKENDNKNSRIILCAYMCKFVTHTKNKKLRISTRPLNYIHNRHIRWLNRHSIEDFLYSFGFCFQKANYKLDSKLLLELMNDNITHNYKYNNNSVVIHQNTVNNNIKLFGINKQLYTI